ncbi:MAG: CocE/NonD family hydrolase [Gammaproteobacteria bacterium]|nr:CocE/NonD family hydrolase [Gammaproteobacteria bacterium]
MKTITSFPHEVRELEHVLIEMPDGCRLAARIWMPADAEQRPVPAILEYLPYRKRDLTAERDEMNHRYFAGHGYAGVRVDLRGSGESDGILRDEYLPVELEDGVNVLQWIASQPWCNGNIGMIGISWGGFNGLQIAALQPPELKAVITICSTDDRYSDDVHYMGGCLLLDNLSWASTMFSQNTCPPDPALVPDWRDQWLERLDQSGLWLETWLHHPHRGDYWKHGSICEDYSQVKCPVMAVSGWADGYSNAVFRMLSNLDVPRKGLIGPWSHKYPHLGIPGPAIDFLGECLRWWNQWLGGRDTGVMDEPMLRVWMQDSAPPQPYYHHRPGRWVAEDRWPSPRIHYEHYPLDAGIVADPGTAVAPKELSIRSPLNVGQFGGKWCSYADIPDLPHDQRSEDGGSLVFQSAPLDEDLEILGAPVVELDLASDEPVAMVAVRLSDLAPDDEVTRVTYGLLNLTHLDSDEHPAPLEPGKRYRVRVWLNDIAQRFPKGHRLRVSLSTSYWPLAWPSPNPTRLSVFTGASSLQLPVRPPRDADTALRDLGAPEAAAPSPRSLLQPPRQEWLITHDLARDRSELKVVFDEGTYHLHDIGLDVHTKVEERYSYRDDTYDSLRGETHWERSFSRGSWRVHTIAHTVMTSDATHFIVRADLDAYEGDARIFTRSWDRRIPRDLV